MRDKKKQDRRSRILSTARKLFAELGYRHTTTRRIAEELDWSLGTFYNYFPDKGALFLELMKEDLLTFARSFRPEGDSTSRLRECLLYFSGFFSFYDKMVFRELTALSLQSTSADVSVWSLMEILQRELTGIFRDLDQQQILADKARPDLLLRILIGIFLRHFLFYINTDVSLEEIRLSLSEECRTLLQTHYR